MQLFHFVALHGGISAALPHVGYGLQQPALSEQMATLEAELGVVLFQRRPFALTAAGQRLYAFTCDFMKELPVALAEVVDLGAPEARIGCSDLLLADYLPRITRRLRETSPGLRVAVCGGATSDRLVKLREGKLDVVIAELNMAPSGFGVQVLAQVPIALLVPKPWRIRVDAWWCVEGPRPSLIIARENEAGCAAFDAGLRRRGIRWRPHITMDCSRHVPAHVVAESAVGLVLDVPQLTGQPGVKRISLEDFPRVQIAALWRRPANAAALAVLDSLGVSGER